MSAKDGCNSASLTREATDFTSPEQTPYNEDFDLVTSNIIFDLRFIAHFALRSSLMHWKSGNSLLLKSVPSFKASYLLACFPKN